MAYVLQINNKGNIVDVIGYSKLPNYENLNETSLNDICEFTTSFFDEYFLLSYLQQNSIADAALHNVNFQIIRRYKNGNEKVLEHNIPFSPDKNYLNLSELKKVYLSLITDIHFFEAFIEKYYDYLSQVPIYAETLHQLRTCYNYFATYNTFPTLSSECIYNFVHNYCTKKDENNEYKTNFKNVLELAMFAKNYERHNLSIRNDLDIDEDDEKYINELYAIQSNLTNILNENNITDEQREEYEKELERISIIFRQNNISLTRRKNNDTTTN